MINERLLSYIAGVALHCCFGGVVMPLFRRLALVLAIIIFSGDALAFEFSNKECEFKVNFPFRPSVKKVVQPLGNGMYSNTYMAEAGGKRSDRVFIANCDTSYRLSPKATVSQKRKMAEWSIREWSKMVSLKNSNMFWEQQGNHLTLKMIGQRVLVQKGKRFNIAFQGRMYLGRRSTMLVGVGEAAELSPSAEMKNFLNNSVSWNR